MGSSFLWEKPPHPAVPGMPKRAARSPAYEKAAFAPAEVIPPAPVYLEHGKAARKSPYRFYYTRQVKPYASPLPRKREKVVFAAPRAPS
ncbi:MAG: hypothetical protein ACI4MU_09440 [Candidatus Ventricola sp.]